MGQPDSGAAHDQFHLLAEELLNCEEEQFVQWLHKHQAQLSLDFLQYLKDTVVTSAAVLRHSQKMDRITRYALCIAATLPNELMAMALAQWMRGLWAMYNHASQAVILFKAALPAYQAAQDKLNVAKLAANLVGVLANVGENLQAEEFYKKAREVFLNYIDQAPQYFVILEQNFGYLLHSWGRHEEALPVHDRALALASQHNLATSIAEIRVNRHLTLGRLGRFSEIETGFLQDRMLAQQAEQPITVARIDMDLGELYTILGRPMEALRRFQGAAQGLVPMEQGPVLATQATLLRHLGAFRAAFTHYQLALSLLAEYGLKTFHAETLVNLASCLRQDGDDKAHNRARDLLNQAETLWQEQDNRYWLVQVYFERILLNHVQNRLQQALTLLANPPALLDNARLQAEFRLLRAETHRLAGISPVEQPSIAEDYEAVLHYATRQGAHWLHRSALSGLGRTFLQSNWPKARQLLEGAAATDDQLRQLLSVQELKASFHRQAHNLYDDLIRGAFAQQEYGFLLQYTWRAKASAFLDLALNHRADLKYPIETQQRITLLRQQIAALRWSLARDNQHSLPDDLREAASPELAGLIDELLQLRRLDHQQTSLTASLTPTSLQNALSKLDADLLIEYVRCGSELYGICANRAGVCVVKRLADSEIIDEIIGRLAHCFESFQRLTPAARQQAANARLAESQLYLTQCYAELVAPLLAEISKDQVIRKILLAPCDLVAMLPFAAFWTGEKYWVETVEIELIQSGALLLLEHPTALAYTPPVVVAAASGAAMAVRQEASAVANELPGSTLFIDTLVIDHLQTLPNPPRILHIAAHSIQRADVPLFAGIQLGGEVLSVEQSFDLPLWGSELVTLSGCTTASGMESDASLFAFQSALLIAGAKRVLCTLWPIADGAAVLLMIHFYRLLQQGVDAPTALRQSQLHFLQEPAYHHPALWAAFTLIRR